MDQFFHEPVYSTEDLGTLRSTIEKGYRRLFGQYLPYWFQVCVAEKANLLHSHFGSAGVCDLGLAQKLNIPHVVSFYGVDIKRPIYKNHHGILKKYKKMFERIAGVFVEGPYAKKLVIDMGCSEKKICISHLGVELSKIKSIKRFWKSGSPFRILLAGTFTRKKGIMIALQALERVLSDNPKMSIEVRIIGDARQWADDLKVKAEILDFINRTSLKYVTKLYGYLPYQRVLSMSYDCHLLIQTSVHAENGDCEGGFPVIITDMMATGMPVIGSDHCDIPEIIKNGQNGFVAREADISATAHCILELLESYNDYASSFREFNREFLRDNFDARNCAKEREEFYERAATKYSNS